ncbi:MAG: alpha-L-fucosidase [Planctomycetaceae bacterium]|nr:alpha-L-fucosidase [Planctomycetaceae bacterium]
MPKLSTTRSASHRKNAAKSRFDWFNEAKFGLFIHWGLMAKLGAALTGNTHVTEIENKTSINTYREIARTFNPVAFDADKWVRMAKAAGMKYVVFISKHVEGFAMFNSKATPHNIVAGTPFKRDPMAELSKACKKHGLTMCFYYCQVLDLEDPDAVGNSVDYPDQDAKVLQRFLDRKVKPQLRELLTQYGPIGLIWFDVPVKITKAQSQELVDLVRSLQPDTLINSRIGHGLYDYISAMDNDNPNAGYSLPWETPATMNNNWNYAANDNAYKSPREIIRTLVDIVSKGGNYLLNIGPTPEGTFPGPSVRRLQDLAKWMAPHSDSIHGAGASPLPRQYVYRWGRVTTKGSRLFLHIFDWPLDDTLTLAGVRNKIRKAYLLADKSRKPLKCTRSAAGDLSVYVPAEKLPARLLDDIDTVVVLELAGAPDIDPRVVLGNKDKTVLAAYEARLHGPNASHVECVWDACVAMAPDWQAGADMWAALPGQFAGKRLSCVSNWRAEDSLSWEIRVDAPGTYDLDLTYDAPKDSVGSEFVVTIGKQTIAAKVESQGYGFEMKSIKLGSVAFDKPTSCTVSIKPRTLTGTWLMNLESVTLTPH